MAINSLLNEYFTLIDKVAGKHNGHIDKYIGDCAMILFGAPVQDEEHDLKGVRCGVEIQQVIQKHNLKLQQKGLRTVEFSVAINSGLMLAGNMGSEKRMEYTVIGNAVNIAARLSSIATAGQVLVTKKLHDSLALATHYETSLSQKIRLRGKKKTVEIWQVEPQLQLTSSTEHPLMNTSATIH